MQFAIFRADRDTMYPRDFVGIVIQNPDEDLLSLMFRADDKLRELNNSVAGAGMWYYREPAKIFQ